MLAGKFENNFKVKKITLFLFAISTLLYAQNTSIEFKNISTKEGLSNGNITAAAQDSLGFIWLGTRQGLNRYDGYEFKKFYTLPGLPNSLADDNITALAFSPDSILWIGTNSKGLSSYNPMNGKFTQYKKFLFNIKNDSYPRILKILNISRGIIWLSTDAGSLIQIKYIQTESKTKLVEINEVNNYSADRNTGVNDFHFLTENKLLVGTDNGLYYLGLDKELNVLKNELLLNEAIIKIRSIGSRFYLITDFRHEKVFVSELLGGELSEANLNFYPFNVNSKSKKSRVTDIIEYNGNPLFASDPFHLTGYASDLKTKTIDKDLAPLFNNIKRLKFTSIFVDKSNLLWGMTNGLGVALEQRKPELFSTLKNIPGDNSSISPTSLRQLVKDPIYGGIWITGYNGISLFKPKTGKIERYNFDLPVYSLALIPGNDKYFLIGTDGSGLYIGNKETGVTKYLNTINENIAILKEGQIFSIYIDNKENVWFSALEGLMKFNLPKDMNNIPSSIDVKFTSVNYNPFEISSKVSQIHPINDSLFYLTTEKRGIIKYNTLNDTYTVIKNDLRNPNSISGNNVKTIFQSSDGNWWVGTTSGLNKWAKTDFKNFRNNFTRILTSDGLPNNVIYGILEDENGNLWLSTNLGLSRFNPSKFTFDNFSDDDGIANNEFNTNSYLKISTGDMCFGGIDGLTYFNPERITEKQSHLKVVFTGFKILNKNHTSEKDIAYSPNVELTSNENIFSVSFSGLDFYNSRQTEYSYQFEEQDSTWIYLGNIQKVTFTNVSPGNYNLRIRARTSFTKWPVRREGASDNLAELSISILPPIWQTWWMYTIYVIIFLVLIYFMRRYEINRQSLKHSAEVEKVRVENLLEIDKAKSDFFANVSHELRTPLTLILGMLETIRIKNKDSEIEEKIDIAFKSGKKQLSMVNQILNLTKIDAGEEKLNASVANIEKFLRYICSSFESLAKLNKLELSYNSDYEIIPVNFDPDKIEKIMNNLLSNAIKFTPANGKISVNINSGLRSPDFQYSGIYDNNSNERYVEIIVKDNGAGIPKEKLVHIFDRFYQADNTSNRKYEGIGIGLSLTKELVELHNGKIKVESEFGAGTSFSVLFPIDFTLPLNEIPELIPIKSEENPEYNLPQSNVELIKKEVVEDFLAEERSKHSVLVIEDNTELRNYIMDNLKSNYEIFEAPNGEEGIEIANREIPDLIITDVMMPKLDGYETTKILRENKATCHIPIIMITARAAEEDKLSGLNAGVDAYLTKPFSIKELFLRVRKLLELRAKLYENIGNGAFINPLELKINSLDKQFLNKLKDAVIENISNENFSVEELAGIMALSVRQLRRKLSALVDIPPAVYIRKIRMKKAKELLTNKNGNVSQVSLAVGYSNFAAFSKVFKDEFGVSPSQMLHNSPTDKSVG